MSKTKEETLESNCAKYGTFLYHGENNLLIEGDSNACLDAMESYAEQQSIAFAEWKHNKGWVFDGEWYNQPDKSTPLLEAKTLYQLFLNDQNK
jgi:hypothetical protein